MSTDKLMLKQILLNQGIIMKKLLLIALLLTLATGTALAQGQGNGKGPGGNGQPGAALGGNSGNPVNRLTEQLGLDEAQAAEVAAIFEETQLLRDEEREKARAAHCDIRLNTHEQILAVLTPEQVALFEEHRQKREDLRQALEEMRQLHGGSDNDRGFGGGSRLQDCDN